MIRWTGLAPWAFEFPFPGSLTSTFLSVLHVGTKSEMNQFESNEILKAAHSRYHMGRVVAFQGLGFRVEGLGLEFRV